MFHYNNFRIEIKRLLSQLKTQGRRSQPLLTTPRNTSAPPKNQILYFLRLQMAFILFQYLLVYTIFTNLMWPLSRSRGRLHFFYLHFMVKGVFSPISPCQGNVFSLSFYITKLLILFYPKLFLFLLRFNRPRARIIISLGLWQSISLQV